MPRKEKYIPKDITSPFLRQSPSYLLKIKMGPQVLTPSLENCTIATWLDVSYIMQIEGR